MGLVSNVQIPKLQAVFSSEVVNIFMGFNFPGFSWVSSVSHVTMEIRYRAAALFTFSSFIFQMALYHFQFDFKSDFSFFFSFFIYKLYLHGRNLIIS